MDDKVLFGTNVCSFDRQRRMMIPKPFFNYGMGEFIYFYKIPNENIVETREQKDLDDAYYRIKESKSSDFDSYHHKFLSNVEKIAVGFDRRMVISKSIIDHLAPATNKLLIVGVGDRFQIRKISEEY